MYNKSIFETFGAISNPLLQSNSTISIHSVQSLVSFSNHHWHGSFKNNQLISVFQPIFSFSHQRVVGYEALTRVQETDGSISNPSHLFYTTKDEHSMTLLDRLCRYLHLKRFCQETDSLNWLFLNVSPQVIAKGRKFGSFFSSLLKEIDFPAYRIVVEIVEHPTYEQKSLQESVDYYRDLGCLIAIDDFGSGHSNFERIWSLKPDIVKLDRSMIQQASNNSRIRQLLPGIVSLLHQNGSLVLIEGVETREQAMIAMETETDFVQGFYFSKPLGSLGELNDSSNLFQSLFEEFKLRSAAKSLKNQTIVNRYQKRFEDAIRLIKSGVVLEKAGAELFIEPTIVRAYLLNPEGIQIGETLHPERTQIVDDIRYRPIQSAKSADWFRRHYLQQAILHQEQMQISKPYLSITGAHMCVTISMMVNTPSGLRVFCCDLDWEA